MSEATRRGVKEGIGFGIIAGIIFAVMEVIGATLMGDHPLMPFRMFASVGLGQAALEPTTPLSTALMVGGAATSFFRGCSVSSMRWSGPGFRSRPEPPGGERRCSAWCSESPRRLRPPRRRTRRRAGIGRDPQPTFRPGAARMVRWSAL